MNRRTMPPSCSVLLALLLPWLGLPAVAQEEAPATSSIERPFLWRIEGDVPSWLFGTIHLPDPRVLALPSAVDTALDEADAFYAELPMDDMEALGEVAKAMRLPADQRLKDVIPSATYERLREYLARRKTPMVPFERLQPWAVGVQLPLLEYMKEFAGAQPLDMVLYFRAKGADKEVGGLESVEEQIGVFEQFTREEQVKLLEESLTQLEEAEESGEDLLEEILTLYIEGDLVGLLDMMDHDETADPELQERFEQLLLWDRNERMAERIHEKLAENPEKSYFFAVGAAHYPTARGVVALLRGKGHVVTRLDAEGRPVVDEFDAVEELRKIEEQVVLLERALKQLEAEVAESPDPDGSLQRLLDEARAQLDALRADVEATRARAGEESGSEPAPKRKAG